MKTIALKMVALLFGILACTSCTPNIHSAAMRGNTVKIQEFLDQGVDVDQRWNDESQMTPLMVAATHGKNKAVTFLLNKGANIEAREKAIGATALALTSASRHTDTMELLLKKGANVHTTIQGKSILAITAANNDVDHVKMLIKYGADRRDVSYNYIVGMRAMHVYGQRRTDPEIMNALEALYR